MRNIMPLFLSYVGPPCLVFTIFHFWTLTPKISFVFSTLTFTFGCKMVELCINIIMYVHFWLRDKMTLSKNFWKNTHNMQRIWTCRNCGQSYRMTWHFWTGGPPVLWCREIECFSQNVFLERYENWKYHWLSNAMGTILCHISKKQFVLQHVPPRLDQSKIS